MKRNALSQMKAKSLPAGKHVDGQGLWLCKSRNDAGKWMLRLSIAGKRREMGLGRWPDVSIAEARERAAAARRSLRDGLDPIAERQKQRRQINRLTVSEAVEGCFKARQAELKGDGKAGRWMSPLNTHVLPKIGKLAIEEIDQHDLKQLLDPIWHDKPDTARKALNRLNLTLKHAAALGLEVDLQATMKARALLGKQRHQVTHIPSMPYWDIPDFYQWLKTRTEISALALRFLILTVARTSEVRLARFDEVEDDVWVLSPERTKTGQEHRIPLVDAALEIMERARAATNGAYLFPSKTGKPLSDMAMSSFMKREEYTARPHGFRGTFRTWAEEQTEASYEVKETCLGHAVDKGVVRVYQRSDRLEKRALLMMQWSKFLTQKAKISYCFGQDI
ncbi:tyrosine-type recombinase/integrase [Parasulfitobacter algicola]|uniref:Integrase arm-type DNA-binding domain-containing protein n=1 Tax=Parasulfitobacter algicola TaxID=2614809 RepID=A0ABX2J0N9_9RHOB|nr:site-specific integrase [Sulfitobacter algicola]NSX56751.1 integrase arm-type DNA-binding domain-containing protein [Sulfitobacter algicola]